MPSKTTTSTDNKFNQAHRGVAKLIDKMGIDKACDLITTLSADSEIGSYATTVKQLAATYFSIEPEEITSESSLSHWHSRIRAICYHILHHSGIDMRQVGRLMNRRENSVQKGVRTMEAIIQRPSSDKIFYAAYAEINTRFQKVRSTSREAIIDSVSQIEPVAGNINDLFRAKIKAEIEMLDLTISALAASVPMPRKSLSEFLAGKQGMKTEHLINLQKKLNIKLF